MSVSSLPPRRPPEPPHPVAQLVDHIRRQVPITTFFDILPTGQVRVYPAECVFLPQQVANDAT